MATLNAKCSLEMDCPKEIVVWNYYDHEHVVGTHYKWYSECKILAERDDWCLVERFYKLPVINLRASSLGFMFAESPNLYRSIQYGKLGTILHQEILLEDIGTERCRVTGTYTMDVPAPFKVLQPLFTKVITRWFHATWEEDAPMRIRRWKVWKLGFRDFRGIDYINKKTAKPADLDPNRPYPLRLPVPKTRESPAGSGYRRHFDKSVEVGY
jgi:hypothetical protein